VIVIVMPSELRSDEAMDRGVWNSREATNPPATILRSILSGRAWVETEVGIGVITILTSSCSTTPRGNVNNSDRLQSNGIHNGDFNLDLERDT